MFDHYADFIIELSRPIVENIKLDYVSIVEDGLAYSNGPLVSPSIYREFYLPYVKRVLDFFRDSGIMLFAECTSGNFDALVPLFLEAGYNIFWPLESAAGMDARRLREEYGERVRLVGNISRQSLMDGKEAVEREFNEKVTPLMEDGGFIPTVDDMIMPDISFESYSHFVKLVRNFQIH
jgi:uroporphyrinogen decarboxylase